jgi:adenine-specific DNA-methyltransferase
MNQRMLITQFCRDLQKIWLKKLRPDLCYIDPPYMKRQYAANYHILETIARGDFPDAIGKSGLRNWWDQHSKLCTKTKGLDSFRSIISKMNCDVFLVSYSEDGLFSLEQLVECFSEFGRVNVEYIDYKRFRSNNSPLPKKLKEYLITIQK